MKNILTFIFLLLPLLALSQSKEADSLYNKGLEIYSISLDSKAKDWKSYVEKKEMTWINVLAHGGAKVYDDYGIEFIPKVFLIDCRTGVILVHEGHPDLNAILAELLP